MNQVVLAFVSLFIKKTTEHLFITCNACQQVLEEQQVEVPGAHLAQVAVNKDTSTWKAVGLDGQCQVEMRQGGRA